ncbi:MAG: hypothetical protein MUF10_00545 [Thermoanaerobaculaceae bacterium]|jgi:hypothetical protein|nr:hypothetical protein [Thermoanaerobaculaceae bacterium]
MPARSRLHTGLLATLLVSAALPVAATEPPPAPTVQPDRVPAAGRHSAIASTFAFGRYAIAATSKQGVALQLVDRMAGPGAARGTPGEADGRLDVFLDRGQVKLLVEGHPSASGEATLSVRPFTELHTPQASLLVEHKLVSAELGDIEQRSWWVSIEAARHVAFEAAGRHLADLRLWRDGVWLEASEPDREVVEPRKGQPLLACRLVTRLEPGLYLLTAYGGPGQPWAAGGEARPFHLRWGVPSLPEALRRRYEVGPFGIDRFLVPGTATFFRIELPEARTAELGVTDYSDETPYGSASAVAAIDKKTVPPVAELRVATTDGHHLVTVRGEAGQPYVLQHFVKRWEYSFRESGDHWLSSVHGGTPQDSVDATAIVQRQRLGQPPDREAFADRAVPLGPGHGLLRRCNLLEELTVFVRVTDTGAYEILSRGADARFRFEPFLTTRPARYEPPPFKPSGTTWNLDAGLYVLTARPEKQGILDFVVRDVGAMALNLALLDHPQDALRAVQGAAQLPKLALDNGSQYTVFLNRQPGVSAGLVLRHLPLDLREALPLVLKPGEELEVPFEVPEAGTLGAVAEDGSRLELRLDGAGWTSTAAAAAGAHTVAVRNPGTATVVGALALEPERLQASTPLPPIPDAVLAGLPQYPVLQADTPQLFDLERRGSRTFLVKVDAPGLYRLETSGLLETAGTLRSRVITSLDAQESNGVGRNFLIQQYLREGDYQLTVRAEGRSAGHLGVRLVPTTLREGGVLLPGLPARVTLGEGEGVLYTFGIPERADYTLRSFGLRQPSTCRLEDAEAWPLVAPGGTAELARAFDAGGYRLVLLPGPVPSRRLTVLEPIVPPLRFAGHGPHHLPLDREVEHLWLEPEGDAQRLPDIWRFELPAMATVGVTLSGEMTGELVRAGEDEVLDRTKPGKGLLTGLPAGRYELRVTSGRPNNRVPYTVMVHPLELLPGQTRSIRIPGILKVSVGAAGMVELSSFGGTDVRAELGAADGRSLARSDDRSDDWNFHIATQLTPGRYDLHVDPVGISGGTSLVRMTTRSEVEEAAWTLPGSREITTGDTAHLVPLTLPPGAELLVVTLRSGEAVGVGVEQELKGTWKPLARQVGRDVRLGMPIPANARLRLRVWSADQRGLPVTVRAAAVVPAKVDESKLSGGAAMAAVPGSDPSVGALAVTVRRPGVLRLEAEGGLVWSGAAGGAAEPAERGLAVVTGDRLWVLGQAGARVRGERLALAADGRELPLTAPAGERLRVDLGKGTAGLWLAHVVSSAGQPVARLLQGSTGEGAVDRVVAVAAQAAATAAVGEPPQVLEVWDGEGGERPLDVRVRVIRLSVPPATPLIGLTTGEVGPGQVLAYDLPAREGRLLVALAPGVVGLTVRDGQVTGVHWGRESISEMALSVGGRLLLARVGPEPGAFSATALLDGSPARLDPARPLILVQPAAGTLRVAVPPSDQRRVRVRGVNGAAVLVGADGRVHRGDGLPAGAGGTLLIPHGPGRVMAWLEPDTGDASVLWGGPSGPPTLPVQIPAVVTLEGAETALEVDPGLRGLVHLRSATPVVSRVTTTSGTRIALHPQALDLDVLAGPELVEVRLRPLDSSVLIGELEVTASPLVAVGEGLGPEVLLAPGQSRGFGFTVTTAGPVGVGVRAEKDVVEATLLDAAGTPLGTGTAMMPRLGPGAYVVVLHAPAGGGALRARPAVVGLVPPSSGPPEEVVRHYLRAARGEPEEETPSVAPETEGEDEETFDEESEEPEGGEEPSEGEGR